MASIDKTYVHTWKDYCEIREWAKNNYIVYSNGDTILWEDLLYPIESEEEFNKRDLVWGVPIWNTNHYEDAVLFRDCPIKLIQDRLKEQYGNPSEELVIKPYKVATKFKVDCSHNRFHHSHYKLSLKWFVEIPDLMYYYNHIEATGYPFCYRLLEPNGLSTVVMPIYTKGNSIKALVRALKRYRIPSDCTIKVHGITNNEQWIVRCK